MAKSDITIGFSEEMRLFISTRLETCRAVNCKNNKAHDIRSESAGCRLKEIFITEAGACGYYESPKREGEA